VCAKTGRDFRVSVSFAFLDRTCSREKRGLLSVFLPSHFFAPFLFFMCSSPLLLPIFSM
jgi:hypothetical protein